MHFGLDEEQRLLDQSVRAMLEDRLPMEERRRIAGTGRGFDDGLWQAAADLGLPGLLVPEEHGGAGLGVLEAAVVAEAIGHQAAPLPFATTAIMGPLAVALAGDDAQRRRLLPAIAAGEARVAVAAGEVAGTTDTGALSTDGTTLAGSVGGVIDAGGATHALVMFADGRMAVVDLAAPGVATTLARPLDRTRSTGTLGLDKVRVEWLPRAADDADIALRVLDAGRIALAADAVGAAQQMLDQAVAYTQQREQFGRVVASFQAVKHMLAETVSALEPCRALVWYAAYAQDHLPDEARIAACHTKAHVGEVTRDASRITTEAHGGMGFTDLLGLHYWFKRIAFDRQVLGGPERCRHEAAGLHGWPA